MTTMHSLFYSERHQQLMELIGASPAMRAEQIDLGRAELPSYIRHYRYPVSSWPLIVSRGQVAEFERFSAGLAPLLYKALRLMFPADAESFAAYLQAPALLHALLAQGDPDLSQALMRHDMLYSGGALKLLEVNAGSTIGGWQVSWLEPDFRAALQRHGGTARWELQHRPVLDGLFGAVLAAMACQPQMQGTALFYLETGPGQSDLHGHYGAIYGSVLPHLLPQRALRFFSDFNELEYAADGSLRHRGQAVDAILLATPEGQEVPHAHMMRLAAAQMSGKLVMPDSPLYTLLGNKSLLALLHEPALQPLLDQSERDFVQRHIPFTARMVAGQVTWQGQRHALGELLLAERERFVVKKSHSLQGRDVHVGRCCTTDEWRAVVQRYLGVEDWLAQEFCPADLASGVDAQGVACDYAFIWGVFDAGQRYSGAFVRGMPAARGQGVINSATGATEFSVFEETARRNRISL